MRLPTVVVRGDVLTSWLTVSDYSKSRLAAELGVSKGRISQLLTSHEEPSAHLMAKLLLVTHLPFDRLFKVISSQPPLRLSRRAVQEDLSNPHSSKGLSARKGNGSHGNGGHASEQKGVA